MNNYRGHPLQAAIDVCPTEEEANLVAAAPAMKKAIEGLLDARFTGGFCPWCGVALNEARTSPREAHGHYTTCATISAYAALNQAEGFTLRSSKSVGGRTP